MALIFAVLTPLLTPIDVLMLPARATRGSPSRSRDYGCLMGFYAVPTVLYFWG